MSEREAWFAGLIDGEGCLTLNICTQHRHSLKCNLAFYLSMKEGDWFQAASKIMGEHQVPFHVYRRKNQVQISILSTKSVKRLLAVLSPYLVVKRPLALAFLAYPPGRPRNRFSPVDQAHVEALSSLVDHVRAFNKGKNRKHRWDGEMVRAYYSVG